MGFTFEQVNTLLDKGFTPEQITALNVTAPVQDAPAGESVNTGGEQSKGGEQTSSSPATGSSPAPTPAEYYKKEEAPQEIPFGGGELQKTFNALMTQMQETTKALTDATKANQESNVKYLEQPGGSAGDTIESITASIIDPSYNMNKGGN